MTPAFRFTSARGEELRENHHLRQHPRNGVYQLRVTLNLPGNIKNPSITVPLLTSNETEARARRDVALLLLEKLKITPRNVRVEIEAGTETNPSP